MVSPSSKQMAATQAVESRTTVARKQARPKLDVAERKSVKDTILAPIMTKYGSNGRESYLGIVRLMLADFREQLSGQLFVIKLFAQDGPEFNTSRMTVDGGFPAIRAAALNSRNIVGQLRAEFTRKVVRFSRTQTCVGHMVMYVYNGVMYVGASHITYRQRCKGLFDKQFSQWRAIRNSVAVLPDDTPKQIVERLIKFGNLNRHCASQAREFIASTMEKARLPELTDAEKLARDEEIARVLADEATQAQTEADRILRRAETFMADVRKRRVAASKQPTQARIAQSEAATTAEPASTEGQALPLEGAVGKVLEASPSSTATATEGD